MPARDQKPRQHEVPEDWRLPDLAALVPHGGRLDSSEESRDVDHLDGPELTLTRIGATLTRAGTTWELSAPSFPAGPMAVLTRRGKRCPAALASRIAGVLGGSAPSLVASVRTSHRRHRLRDADDEVLAEVVDTEHHGVATGATARTTSWRTVEVKPGELGAALTELFGGLDPAPPSDVRRVLDVGSPRDDALTAYVVEQCRRILLGDLALRDEVRPDRVHRSRVAVRRLRSTIRTFPTTLSDDARTRADADLRRLAGLLGEVRDADVLERHLHEELAELPAELVMGPVRDELDEALGERRGAAVDRWREASDGEEYLATLSLVAGWLAEPPVAPRSRKALQREGRAVLKRARRTAAKRLRQAGDDPARVHRARKAVKRLRYTAGALEGVVPRARRDQKRARRLQKRLGRHQDLVVRAAFLRATGARFGARAGHNGFVHGLLWERAEAGARAIRESRPCW